MRRVLLPSAWRKEALRTNLWLVPTVEVACAAGLFAGTYAVDRAAYRGALTLPAWFYSGTADSVRQILAAIAAAEITVVGVVFSITIVALTLASTQFGPRMLRNFIRDRVTQFTLGTFVASFFYAVLTLISISPGRHGDFVPHLSTTVSLMLVVIDLGVLILFIDHISKLIQLPQVIASIAGDLAQAIDAEIPADSVRGLRAGPSVSEMTTRMDGLGGVVRARSSGYLQFVRLDTLMGIASRTHSVVSLHLRPGHFVSEGQRLATVWPAEAAPRVAEALDRAHATGPHRTLTQDLSFAIDQLVEIAIRALSPAVNDTFTALTCIDWLGDSLSKICARWNPTTVHRDRAGRLRVITVAVSDERLIDRAFEKIRQAGRGMPAVAIRQLDAIASIMEHATTERQQDALVAQALMILQASTTSVPEERDRADIQRAYNAIHSTRASFLPRNGAPRSGWSDSGSEKGRPGRP
jgi:uncharacterized membrane protein